MLKGRDLSTLHDTQRPPRPPGTPSLVVSDYYHRARAAADALEVPYAAMSLIDSGLFADEGVGDRRVDIWVEVEVFR